MCMSALVLVVNGQTLAAKQGDQKKVHGQLSVNSYR